MKKEITFNKKIHKSELAPLQDVQVLYQGSQQASLCRKQIHPEKRRLEYVVILPLKNGIPEGWVP